ncbi:hypothetical protein D4765_14050 [Subtercola vilae]|uniref:ArsR family transcriptional regulator n=2 Tax=Subtercola vilae TaxID=2056433 RepID=A0A4T2BTN9_9MICO|nr:hypothetical protein D4765_14050 [Subtercola vilae]
MTIPASEVIRAISASAESVSEIVRRTCLRSDEVSETLDELERVGCVSELSVNGDTLYRANRHQISTVTLFGGFPGTT